MLLLFDHRLDNHGLGNLSCAQLRLIIFQDFLEEYLISSLLTPSVRSFGSLPRCTRSVVDSTPVRRGCVISDKLLLPPIPFINNPPSLLHYLSNSTLPTPSPIQFLPSKRSPPSIFPQLIPNNPTPQLNPPSSLRKTPPTSGTANVRNSMSPDSSGIHGGMDGRWGGNGCGGEGDSIKRRGGRECGWGE